MRQLCELVIKMRPPMYEEIIVYYLRLSRNTLSIFVLLETNE